MNFPLYSKVWVWKDDIWVRASVVNESSAGGSEGAGNSVTVRIDGRESEGDMVFDEKLVHLTEPDSFAHVEVRRTVTTLSTLRVTLAFARPVHSARVLCIDSAHLFCF